MLLRNVNPEGLAWPDYLFVRKPRVKKTWKQEFAEFLAELSEIDHNFSSKKVEVRREAEGIERRGDRWS